MLHKIEKRGTLVVVRCWIGFVFSLRRLSLSSVSASTASGLWGARSLVSAASQYSKQRPLGPPAFWESWKARQVKIFLSWFVLTSEGQFVIHGTVINPFQ